MLHSAPSDRVKIAVSLCAITSSTFTLAAYFGVVDLGTRPASAAGSRPGVVFDATTMGDATLFPPGLGELMGKTPASS